MKDLRLSDMIAMQDALQERMKDHWLPIIPENGHFSLLWMYEELGEVVAIIKKRGSAAIMSDEEVREAFVVELADALMYYIDLITCYRVTTEELSTAYTTKHERNMQRDFVGEHSKYLHSEEA